MSFLNDKPSGTGDACAMQEVAVANQLEDMSILILEDEFLIAMDIEQICYDCGARSVRIVRSVDEAATLPDPLEGIDAAVIDVMLAGVSTFDFAARLVEARIPFVFASGIGLTDTIEARFPGVRLVGKPYSSDDLVGALDAAIRG